MQNLSELTGLVIDMDGVLWRGEEPLPGLRSFFAKLGERQLPFVLATNNATQTTERVQTKLDGFGVHIQPEQVLTSAFGTAAFLARKIPADSKVYVVGEAALREALTAAGYAVTPTGEDAAAVVVGMDFSLRWEQLAEAAYALSSDAYFLGTNPDASFPTERGLAPGNGAILAALERATDRRPEIYGKPEPHLFLDSLERMGTEPERTLAVGDRLETDILGGQRAGLSTALMLTGVTDRSDLAASDTRPDWIFENLEELTGAL